MLNSVAIEFSQTMDGDAFEMFSDVLPESVGSIADELSKEMGLPEKALPPSVFGGFVSAREDDAKAIADAGMTKAELEDLMNGERTDTLTEAEMAAMQGGGSAVASKPAEMSTMEAAFKVAEADKEIAKITADVKGWEVERAKASYQADMIAGQRKVLEEALSDARVRVDMYAKSASLPKYEAALKQAEISLAALPMSEVDAAKAKVAELDAKLIPAKTQIQNLIAETANAKAIYTKATDDAMSAKVANLAASSAPKVSDLVSAEVTAKVPAHSEAISKVDAQITALKEAYKTSTKGQKISITAKLKHLDKAKNALVKEAEASVMPGGGSKAHDAIHADAKLAEAIAPKSEKLTAIKSDIDRLVQERDTAKPGSTQYKLANAKLLVATQAKAKEADRVRQDEIARLTQVVANGKVADSLDGKNAPNVGVYDPENEKKLRDVGFKIAAAKDATEKFQLHMERAETMKAMARVENSKLAMLRAEAFEAETKFAHGVGTKDAADNALIAMKDHEDAAFFAKDDAKKAESTVRAYVMKGGMSIGTLSVQQDAPELAAKEIPASEAKLGFSDAAPRALYEAAAAATITAGRGVTLPHPKPKNGFEEGKNAQAIAEHMKAVRAAIQSVPGADPKAADLAPKIVREMLDTWAGSSEGGRAFGARMALGIATPEEEKAFVKDLGFGEANIDDARLAMREAYAAHQDAMRQLGKAGTTERLFRGIGGGQAPLVRAAVEAAKKEGRDYVDIDLRSLASFSRSKGVAKLKLEKSFADGSEGVIIESDVPVEKHFSSDATNMDIRNMSEDEVLVMSPHGKIRIHVKKVHFKEKFSTI
jgi:hypothetical protein